MEGPTLTGFYIIFASVMTLAGVIFGRDSDDEGAPRYEMWTARVLGWVALAVGFQLAWLILQHRPEGLSRIHMSSHATIVVLVVVLLSFWANARASR